MFYLIATLPRRSRPRRWIIPSPLITRTTAPWFRLDP